MIKFLVIEQDLRVSGTSQGIISRSFLGKLRKAYPKATIDVVYLKQASSNDQLELLPVNNIETHILNLKIPFFTKWYNKLYWRLFHISLKERHIHNVYASYISKVDYQKYDHIFIRSAGLEHETILGSRGLPILSKAIVNFHDPYPLFWYPGTKSKLNGLEVFSLKRMENVVSQAKRCMSSSSLMSEDLQFLYGSKKKFYTLPHQYCSNVFNLSDHSKTIKKSRKVMITYHGALMFGRNLKILLESYDELVNTSNLYKENTEFVLRIKGEGTAELIKKYSENENIVILDMLDFSNSAYEQIHLSDINIVLENGPLYSNTLVGKAPFLASIEKPILSISPKRSELNKIVDDKQYIANVNDKNEIKQKLEDLIIDRLNLNHPVNPFGDYFSDENFKLMLDRILEAKDD